MNASMKSLHLDCASELANRSVARKKTLFLSLLIALGTACSIHAQGELGIAQLTSVAGGGGAYNYTITLQNTGPTTIGSFWYGWTPSAFYLPTAPTSPLGLTGWSGTVVTALGGSSIEFVASSLAYYLGAGQSTTFTFTSMDSPATLAGNSPVHATFPTGSSWLYQAGLFSDAGAEIIVQSVPEPSLLGLLSVGSLALVSFCKRAQLFRAGK
jgi:hypothetical protein